MRLGTAIALWTHIEAPENLVSLNSGKEKFNQNIVNFTLNMNVIK